MTIDTLASFEHRTNNAAADGRDRWTVRAVDTWVRHELAHLLADSRGTLLDVGCGGQPFRELVEQSGWRYRAMDVVQNSSQTVDVVGTLESVDSLAESFDVVLCTEVLEHVIDIDDAFCGLRRLTRPGGAVVITVPFIFPMHMEPYDFRRLTLEGVEGLARKHGFAIRMRVRLGQSTDVLATLAADVSILPNRGSLYGSAKARLLRMGRRALVRLLDSPSLSRHVTINSNTYLSNGIVLQAP